MWNAWNAARPWWTKAGATMTEVVSAIRRVTDIMGEISAASSEQSQGRLASRRGHHADGPGHAAKRRPGGTKPPPPTATSKPRLTSWWMPWQCSAFRTTPRATAAPRPPQCAAVPCSIASGLPQRGAAPADRPERQRPAVRNQAQVSWASESTKPSASTARTGWPWL